MITLLAGLLFGATQFTEQVLPGLSAGSRAFPAALATTNAISADIDGDGLRDLVLPSGVWLQRSQAYPAASKISLPREAQAAALASAQGRLYAYSAGEIRSYSLFGTRWQTEWSARLRLGAGERAADTPVFHDLDGDGRLELVVALEQGLRVYGLGASLPRLGDFDLYPPARAVLAPAMNLWVSMPRPQPAVSAVRDLRLIFGEATLLTRELLSSGEGLVTHQLSRYAIGRLPDGTLALRQVEASFAGPFSDSMRPCVLGLSSGVSFAGARAVAPGTLGFGTPIVEAQIAADATRPIQILRVKSPIAFLALADFDADGDADLLTQSNTLENGAPREIVMAMASAHRVRHLFDVHVQDSERRFDSRPRRALAIDLDLGGPALEGGPHWRAYRDGTLTAASADFDGDGRADIAAGVAPGRIAVWLNHEGVFEKKPDVENESKSGAGFLPADVDADGRADLVVLPEAGAVNPPTVFFSR